MKGRGLRRRLGFGGLRLWQNLMNQLGLQTFGKSKCAGTAHAVGQLAVDHVAVNARDGRIVVQGGGDHGFSRLLENLAQENRLKLAARLANLVGIGNIRIRREFFDRQIRGLNMRLERRNIHING